MNEASRSFPHMELKWLYNLIQAYLQAYSHTAQQKSAKCQHLPKVRYVCKNISHPGQYN